ncbi:hypothetical protein BC629DRAFT_1560546 [Irpex lacteus]|nr:hypothetical protein BC629DRAFT_1560546 [Irpex lacteus]
MRKAGPQSSPPTNSIMGSKRLTWLVTGTSSGIELVLNILARGDKVIATARGRSFSKLTDLREKGAYICELDVVSGQDHLNAFAKQIIGEHGHIDVLVNNAGYVEVTTQESSTPEEVTAQFNTNVFAPLNINRAFLPYMRERKTGVIVWIGSLGGWQSYGVISLYCATKHAVRALSVGLDQEISSLGLRSICFELGAFSTDVNNSQNRGNGNTRIPAYNGITEAVIKSLEDPAKAAQAMIDVVRGEGIAEGRVAPPVIALGSDAYNSIFDTVNEFQARLENWKTLTCSTDLIPR